MIQKKRHSFLKECRINQYCIDGGNFAVNIHLLLNPIDKIIPGSIIFCAYAHYFIAISDIVLKCAALCLRNQSMQGMLGANFRCA
jgi:hypothetical protein